MLLLHIAVMYLDLYVLREIAIVVRSDLRKQLFL